MTDIATALALPPWSQWKLPEVLDQSASGQPLPGLLKYSMLQRAARSPVYVRLPQALRCAQSSRVQLPQKYCRSTLLCRSLDGCLDAGYDCTSDDVMWSTAAIGNAPAEHEAGLR